MKKIIFLFAILLNSVAWSQFTQIPTIRLQDNGKSVVLKDLKLSVFVAENVATTTMEMQFYNPNNRVLEGELNFPLANGVTVSRFALDVNGEMREGVVVEKEQATQAFEAITRRQVDPGLVEVTKGNNFKARVYPIPAQGYKKVIVAFEQALKSDEQNYLYQLPLNIKRKLTNFSVRVEVVKNRPEVVQGKHPSINLTFQKARNSYISEYEKKDIKLASQLAFAIPKPDQVNEVMTYRGEITSDNYFYINTSIKQTQRPKAKPQQIAIVWDVSNSSKNRNITKEQSILMQYLEWMNAGSVRFITFSNRVHVDKKFAITNGESKPLIKQLKSLKYDGGTNLSAFNFANIKAEEILLFTDGISSFGNKNINQFKSPVSVINTANITNHTLLNHFASVSNGVYVNMLEQSVSEAMNLLTHEQMRFIRAVYNKNQVKEVYPKTGQVVLDEFSCSGIMEGAKSSIELQFGYGNQVTETKTITIDNTQRIASNIGERMWAQQKLQALLIVDKHSDITAHGKKFKLVTSGTSLIVLDNVSDYVQYQIPPPPSLRKEYDRLISQQQTKDSQNQQDRMEKICSMFEQDYKWWENPIKKIAKRKNIGNPNPVDEPIELEYDMQDEVLEEVVLTGYSNRSDSRRLRGEEAKSVRDNKGSKPTIKIRAWNSKASYMGDLKATSIDDLYDTYLELKVENGENPSFYFDVATYLLQKNRREEGLRVLSNLAELELENPELLRTIGRKLYEHGFYNEALSVFKEVLKFRSFEPHSYLDLGMVYQAKKQYQKAIEHFYTIISKHWDMEIISRFSGIELIVLHDINNIIHQHKSKLDISFIDECLIKHMPVDIRIVIDWDANDTDIDLWVTDPKKEKCSYSNKETAIGGKISNDITRGYGPEEFRLKKAVDGTYRIDANFYGSSKQTLVGNVTVRALVYTNFGTKQEKQQILTLQLNPKGEGEYLVGEVSF